MSSNNFYMKVWGARGSIPTPGPETVKYGGNTSCLEVRCGDELIIFDAGTGIRQLGRNLMNEMPLKASILFSHLHWDHIQGFPFFSPFYAQTNNAFTLYAERKVGGTLEELLSAQMKYPFFPVPIPKSPCDFTFNDIEADTETYIGGAKIISYRANHPDGCLTYRVEYNGKSIVYATDTEHTDKIDKTLCKAAEGADIFIYDCNFTTEEYKYRKGWGHSTWEEGLKIVKEAEAKKLILWHHDPMHNDAFIADLEKEVQKEYPDSVAAHEGLTLYL